MQLSREVCLLLFFVIIANSIGYFATDVYLPAMPQMAVQLDVSHSLTQLTLTAFFLSWCVTPVIFGPISDRKGRKPVILQGLLVAIVGTVICAISSDIYVLLFGRFIQGIGLGACVAAARAIIPDKYHGEEMAQLITVISMSMPIFLAFGPFIGGVIVKFYDWQAVFWFLLAAIMVTFIFFTSHFENTNTPNQNIEVPTKVYWALLKNKLFILYGLYPICTFVGLMAYMTASPFLFQTLLGLSPTEYGVLGMVVGVVIFISGFINTRLLKRYDARSLLWLNLLFMYIASAMLLIFNALHMLSVTTLLLPALIYFAAMPLGFPNAYARAYMQIKDNFGAAGSLLTTLQLILGCLTTFVFSFVPENDFMPLGTMYLLTAVVASGIFWLINKQEQKIK